jgi:transcriptional regulator with XRE-family HTH domain
MSAARHDADMFDDRVGAVLRAVRICRGLRQVDLARLAVVSPMTVSRLEHGQLEALTVRAIRRIARVLEVRMDFAPWSWHGDLHRFATAEHAALVESVVRALIALGWDARAEVSFNRDGDRGFVDILAWHVATRTLLVIEIKTEIVDVGEMLGTLSRKQRLAGAIARELGWTPDVVATALIVRDRRTNRRRVDDHRATIRTVLPDDGRRLRAFLRHPAGSLAAVAFWPNEHPGVVRQRGPATRRVRRTKSCSAAPR